MTESGIDEAVREMQRGWDASAARRVLDRLVPEIHARLAEIGDGTGCETHAARAREAGRWQAVTVDMWDALGLPRPDLDGG
jgi:hypothetical protein